MEKVIVSQQRVDASIGMKIPRGDISREYLKKYMLRNYDLYDQLYQILNTQSAYYSKPEKLRHPLIFYYGHTSAFYINKFVDKRIIPQQINRKYQSLFAVGVDEMQWDDLDKTDYKWPTIEQTIEYRKLIRQKIIEVVDKIDIEKNDWNSDLWIMMMVIDHEKIHFETTSAIMRQLPIQDIKPSEVLIDCPLAIYDWESYVCMNQLKTVNACQVKWQRTSLKTANYYGWDNQFGQSIFNVHEFKASKMLVSNGEYMEFVKDGGYQNLQFWDQEGSEWLKSTKVTKPVSWIENGDSYKYRTMNKVTALPLDWPVEVNNYQATAFCIWKSKKTNKKIRLPTEEQYHALRQLLPYDHFEWEQGKTANINMEVWNSPCPVNLFEMNGFYDIIGNVWQHTCTPFYPMKGFEIHPAYEDYSTPSFDGKHYIMKGGSYATMGNSSTKCTRNTYRRHFYTFAGFRYVQSQVQPQTPKILLDQSDSVVQKFLKIHYLKDQSYIHEAINILKTQCAYPQQKFIHVGCSVGYMILEMSKYFRKSYGIDFSARFFQMVSRILEKGKLTYKDIQLDIEKINPMKDSIVLYQANPQNPDPNKLNQFKVAVVDGLVIKQGTIYNVVSRLVPLMVAESLILIVNVPERNYLTPESLKQISNNCNLLSQKIVPQQQDISQTISLSLYKINQ